ncbi:MAG: F0F1 ATP synthase subunit gamma [Candidatus Omnitrophota bacterium]
MGAIAKLKDDMNFYRSLGGLIELLKMIAITHYHNLEKKLETYEEYLKVIAGFFSWLDMQKTSHPFMRSSDKPTGIVAITSDGGLLGGYNALIMNEAMRQRQEEDGKLIIVGKRGKLYVEKQKIVYAVFPGITNAGRLEQALKLRDYLVEQALKGNLGKIKIVFSNPISFTLQRVETIQLLPFVQKIRRPPKLEVKDVIFESDFAGLAEYLIHLWMGQRVFEILGLSQLSEQAARFMHLEVCTQRIKEMDQKLKFKYFRARHEIVDQNMRELFSARIMNAQ